MTERDFIYLASDPKRTMKEICADVLTRHPGVTLEDLAGPRKPSDIVNARYEAIFTILEERRDLSFPQVGRFFNRDHGTIIKAYHKWRQQNGARTMFSDLQENAQGRFL